MRHRALFKCACSVEQLCTWFVSELEQQGFSLDGEIVQGRHAYRVSVTNNQQQLSFSVFANQGAETNICIYVEPKLGFINALLGKNDVTRELATKLTHNILNHSAEISMLGWYTDTQVWKGATETP